MVDPVKVTIGNRTRAGDEDREGNGSTELQANIRIEQKVEVVDPRGKEQRLLELLKEAQKGSAKNDRILVFCLYKKEAVRVEQNLERRGIRVASIHGDLRQDQRTRSLEAFKAGTTTVLVATDVAARGLDIPEVKLVINVTVSTPRRRIEARKLTRPVPPDHRGLRPSHWANWPRRQEGQGHHAVH
jgi:ATP-dependent RNA helicase DBP3